MKLFLTFFSFSILFIGVSAQNLLGQQKDMRFKHISFEQGLMQCPISVISQDNKGFIWVGNWKGLFRYDGSAFKWFRHTDSDSASISNNRVNSICRGEGNDLLIGTAYGLNLFDSKTETFKYIDIKKVKGGQNFISSVIKDHKNRVWIATFSGIKLANLKEGRIEDIKSFNTTYTRNLFNGITLSLYEDSRHSIWVGTTQGARRFDPASRQILSLPEALAKDKDFRQAKIVVIKEDRRRNMWFGTEKDGIYHFDVETVVARRYDQYMSSNLEAF